MFTKDELTNALVDFKEKRDTLIFDDISYFEHNVKRLVNMLQNNVLVQEILKPILDDHHSNAEAWWNKLMNEWSRRGSGMWEFPDDSNAELALRFYLTQDIANQKLGSMWGYIQIGVRDVSSAKKTLLDVIIRPFLADLTRRLGKLAQIPSKEVRDLQAVPLTRIPNEQTKIFLSHRTIDKPRVMRYYRALKELGFDPWLDEPEMPAGRRVDRSIKQGFKDSCAVVFFITKNFEDVSFIADEIDNAKIEERRKGKKFAIITLLIEDEVTVPDLLENYTYKHITNDLDGLHQVIRALPIELSAVLWKKDTV